MQGEIEPFCLTVEAAIFTAEREQLLVRFIGRREDKHSGVEAIGPTRIWCGRELLPLKQLVYI